MPWKFVEKLFFNKGLMFNKRSDSFGKGRQGIFSQKNVKFFSHKHVWRKTLPAKKSCHNSETSKHYMASEKVVFLATIANRATNQDPTFFGWTFSSSKVDAPALQPGVPSQGEIGKLGNESILILESNMGSFSIKNGAYHPQKSRSSHENPGHSLGDDRDVILLHVPQS